MAIQELPAAPAWKSSLETIKVEAEKGDAYYQGLLGIHLKFGGPGIIIDLPESKRWSVKAAERKGAFGLCNLASLEIRERNYEKGRFLFDEAHLHSNLLRLSRAEDAVAIFCLGLIEMEAPPQNMPKALRHFQESSSKGFPPAQATLGMLKLKGIGTIRDQEVGIKWLQKAAQAGTPHAMFHLGMAYSIGEGVSFDQGKSMQLIKKAAAHGLGSAQLTLGMKFANGEGVEQDYSQAIEWLHKASEQEIGEATFQLRRCETMLKHHNSISSTAPATAPPASPEASLEPSPPLEPVVATEEPSPTPGPVETAPSVPAESTPPIGEDSQVLLRQARHLLLVERKTDEAERILEMLAREGITEAQKLLGISHYRSLDYKLAHSWLLQAAQKNDPQAQRYLGMTFFLGQGVDRDYAQASAWLSKSAAQGDKEAIRYREILKKFYQE